MNLAPHESGTSNSLLEESRVSQYSVGEEEDRTSMHTAKEQA